MVKNQNEIKKLLNSVKFKSIKVNAYNNVHRTQKDVLWDEKWIEELF